MTGFYKPEGLTTESRDPMSIQALESAMLTGKILEAKAILCDRDHNLSVSLGHMKGVIPKEEAALSTDSGQVRDIAVITRVGKSVCFKVTGFSTDETGNTVALLSRKAAQQECYQKYIKARKPGDVIPARVTHLEQFGCFVDIGCGIISLITIDNISTSRISHPRDRFYVGQSIRAVVKGFQPDGKISLTHKELLGTWEENVQNFSAGQTAAGVIRSIESYGIFVELAPNLAGLAEWRENTQVGQTASVYIKNIIPEKMKVKLIIIDAFDAPPVCVTDSDYFITSGHLSYWRYTPPGCDKVIETQFE